MLQHNTQSGEVAVVTIYSLISTKGSPMLDLCEIGDCFEIGILMKFKGGGRQ